MTPWGGVLLGHWLCMALPLGKLWLHLAPHCGEYECPNRNLNPSLHSPMDSITYWINGIALWQTFTQRTGKSPCYELLNQLFLWLFSIATVSLPGRVYCICLFPGDSVLLNLLRCAAQTPVLVGCCSWHWGFTNATELNDRFVERNRWIWKPLVSRFLKEAFLTLAH